MTRIFTGDYSTGTLNQWEVLQNDLVNAAPSAYPGGYHVRAVSQGGDCGYCARYEVRDGDVPPFGGGERSEASAQTPAEAAAGTTRWYAFSVKFDSSWPSDHSANFGVTNQWYDDSGAGSPTVHWGFYATTPSGYWSLIHMPQSSPGVFLGTTRLLDVPLVVGNWIDIKMAVLWSTSDATGTVRCWLNGVAQNLGGGGTTFAGRTMIPGSTEVYYSEGYYRDAAMTTTGIVYHTGFRMADSEASL